LPIVDELAGEMADKLTIVKMNVDLNREVAQKFDIKGLPTMILFNGGTEIDRLVGFMPKEKIVEKLTAKIG
jgi:thioredoxin 1